MRIIGGTREISLATSRQRVAPTDCSIPLFPSEIFTRLPHSGEYRNPPIVRVEFVTVTRLTATYNESQLMRDRYDVHIPRFTRRQHRTHFNIAMDVTSIASEGSSRWRIIVVRCNKDDKMILDGSAMETIQGRRGRRISLSWSVRLGD